MAFAPLILQESLRAWHAAGVTHFLLDPGTHESAATIENGCVDSGQIPAALRRFPESKGVPARLVEPAVPLRTGSGGPVPATSCVGRDEILPPRTEWPELWVRQCGHVPARPLVVWTYAALGRDLCCTPDPERRERLRALLQPLHLPKGSSGFLPCILPDLPAGSPMPPDLGGMDFTPNRRVFWAILQETRPRLLVVFGLNALDAIWPGHALYVYRQANHRGIHVIVLPDMFPEPPQEAAALPMAAVSAYLSTVFSALTGTG